MGEVFGLPIKNYNELRCLFYTYLHVARAHAGALPGGLNFMHKCIKTRGVIADGTNEKGSNKVQEKRV